MNDPIVGRIVAKHHPDPEPTEDERREAEGRRQTTVIKECLDCRPYR